MVNLTDKLTGPQSARICADGSLVAEVNAARVGVQQYLASEVNAPDTFARDAVINVYRPEKSVFNTDSMASFAAAPFTIDHPSQPVDSKNWKALGVGEVNGDVVRDGGFVRVPVIVRDAIAVEQIQKTHKELSMGYSCDLEWTSGVTADGQSYDAIQNNIRINHIAAVKAARGGSELKISDERNAPKNKEKVVETITLDGLPVKLDDADAVKAAFKKLQDMAAKSAKELEEDKAKNAKEMAEKDAEIDDLKSKVVDEATIDARAAEKADVLAKAKTIAKDADFAGKTVSEIKRMTVAAKLGDSVVADKCDIYVDARFAAMIESTDSLKDAISNPAVHVDALTAMNDAKEKRKAAIADAWKMETK